MLSTLEPHELDVQVKSKKLNIIYRLMRLVEDLVVTTPGIS